MKVLVTGGTGYIGSRVTDFLKKQGDDVSTLGSKSKADIVADVTDFDEVKKAVKSFDAVCHLAGRIGAKASFENPREYFLVNSVGTLNVLEAARLAETKRVVFTSSLTVYGKANYLPIDEKHPTNPLSPYGYSKLVAEEICRNYSQMYGLNVNIVRISYVYGPGQENLLIPTIISQLEKEKVVLKNLDFKLDYIFVDDIASAIAKCLDIDSSDVFNIGFGKSTSGKELIDAFSRVVGKELNVQVTDPKREEEQVLNIDKAKRVLGWEPKIDIEEGIRRILASSTSP